MMSPNYGKVIALLACFVCSAASAETIHLKNGQVVEGTVESKDQQDTVIKVPYGTMKVSNSDIVSSSRVQESEPVASPAASIPPRPTPSVAKPLASSSSNQAVLFTPSENITEEEIEKRAILYFWEQAEPQSGLIRDRSRNGSPSSTATCCFGLVALCIGVERGWLQKDAVESRIRALLATLKDRAKTQHGFYYHFLDEHSAQRTWSSEISSIDNALLMAGLLFVAEYFPDSVLATKARMIVDRADWQWFLNGQNTLCMDWKPESGFSHARWDTYAEHMILYILAMGSNHHSIPQRCWKASTRKVKIYAHFSYVHNPQGSLFVYLFSQAWIDFRNRRDGNISYWANTVAAIKANRQFCQDQKKIFKTYENSVWGLSETDGPNGYKHYGAVAGGHDGTIAPYALISSLPFVPDLARAGIQALSKKYADKIWKQSVYISKLSYILAAVTKQVNPEKALLAGLVCDIGAIPFLSFAANLPKDYCAESDIELILPYVKGPIGYKVLNDWGFSEEFLKIPLDSENWYQNSSDELNLTDIVVLSRFHSRIGQPNKPRLPTLASIPATNKFKKSPLSPDLSLYVLHKAKQQVNDVMKAFTS